MLNKLKKIRLDRNGKMVISLVILLTLLVSPVLFAKNSPSKEVAKAGENSPNPIPTSTPDEPKSPEPTPTPEPAKPEAPKDPVPVKKQTQAPVKKSTTQSNPTPQAPTSKPKTTTNSNSVNQPSTPAPQTPAPAPQPAVSGILGYINQVRAENGLVQLTYSGQLNSAAKAKSQDMFDNNYFSHTSPDGRSDFDFIRAAGYSFRYAGSNIAKGNFSERSVFDAWMNSSGHRANILDARAREFGYGVAGNYYTMMVGAK